MSDRKCLSALVPFCLVLLVFVEAGWAIPKLISFQGVLVDKQGIPVDGTFEVTFRMYHQEKEGTAVWEEKQTVTVSDGVYHTLLGNVKPVNVDFSKDVWLGVQVGANMEMVPRFRLASVAYAFRAETAETLQGKTATDFAASGHTHPSPDLSPYAKSSELSQAGAINTATNPMDWTRLKGVPAGFADGVDDGGTTYAAGPGLGLSGSTFSLLGTCTANQILKWSGTTWACANDGDTTYTAGTGLSLTGGAFSLNFAGSGTANTAGRSDHDHDAAYVNEGQAASVSSAMIVDGQIVDADIATGAAIAMSKLEGDPKTAGTINTGTNPIDWTKLKGVPAGIADGVDSDTTYSAGAGGGLSLAGTAFSLLGTCAANQILKWNGTAWACAADDNPVTPAGMVAFFNLASCPAGWTEFTTARGRYIVGLPLSGTLAGTAGTALTDLENRAVGQHNHTITDPGHSHTRPNLLTTGAGKDYTATGGFATGTVGSNSSATGITIDNAGTVAGTNAPYIQLLACQKS